MAQLILTNQEITTLIDLLQHDQSDLRMEIANTDRMEFRNKLKETKMVTQSILEKLQKSLPTEKEEVKEDQPA